MVIYWRKKGSVDGRLYVVHLEDSETPDAEHDMPLLFLLYVVANKHERSLFEDTVPFPNLSSLGYDRCPEQTAWMVEQGRARAKVTNKGRAPCSR